MLGPLRRKAAAGIAATPTRPLWHRGCGLSLRFFCSPVAHDVAAATAFVSPETFEVLRGGFREGLLQILPAQRTEASSDSSLTRGSIVQHDGGSWVCLLEIENYWFAVPLDYQPHTEGAWTVRWRGQKSDNIAAAEASAENAEASVRSLLRSTPTQAEREQLREGISTGVVALDVLAPIGRGQSLLICGPYGSGKSMLAADIIEQVLTSNLFDKVVKFCGDPCVPLVDVSLRRDRCYAELAVVPGGCQDVHQAPALLPSLFAAVSAAEEVRDAGRHALLVIDTLAPMLETWQVALRWAEAEREAPLDPDVAGAQRRVFFANLFERASLLVRGGSLTVLALVESEAMGAIGASGAHDRASVAHTTSAAGSQRCYDLADFKGRKASEVERLRVLHERGVALTDAILSKIGIASPGCIPAAATSPASASEDAAVMRELQSLSDGQVVLDSSRAAAGLFPAIEAATTISRFGLGSTGAGGSSEPLGPAEAARAMAEMRDVRPPALQAVSAHLRMQLALEREVRFRPPAAGESAGGSGTSASAADSDHAMSHQMEVVQAALLQPLHSHLQTEEMVALLVAACSGALDALPLDKARAAVRGGLRAPLLQHLHNTAPKVLEKIKGEPRVSQSTARELDVAVRLFAALQEA